jgi:hypothetical protein
VKRLHVTVFFPTSMRLADCVGYLADRGFVCTGIGPSVEPIDGKSFRYTATEAHGVKAGGAR